jgi:CPA2 family monovalent cation:H+ antiporter-2
MALGAFLAGMMLGETEFRHQIEIEIRPFRDVLLGLFFITVGMFLDITILPDIWLKVLILLVLMVVFKTVLIALIARVFRSDWYVSTRTGLILAHGGEFGFALLTLAFANKLLSPEHGQIVLTALIFSMGLAPFLIRYNKKITQALLPRASLKNQQSLQESISHAAGQLRDHIIICGYGRVGQNIARILETEGFQFVALDMDPQRIQQAQLAGDPVMYGNSLHLSILESAGLAKAKALIISFDDIHTTFKILEQVRQVNPKLPILVRTTDDTDLEELQKAGATEVIPETLEASLMMAFHTLILMDVPPARALRQIREIRKNRYDLLHRIFPDLLDSADPEQQHEQLFVLNLPEDAYAAGKSLEELHLERYDVRLTAIHRKGVRRPDPGSQTLLQANDGLVLYGTPPHLEQAERVLLEGGEE